MYKAKAKRKEDRWERSEFEAIRDNYLTMTDAQISELLGTERRSEASVKTMRITLGFKRLERKDG